MSVSIQHRAFSVEEYHRMGEVGILGEDDRLELIRGEIVAMSPIGAKHAACVDRLFNISLDPESAIVRVQSPLRVSANSEPEPDLSILRYRADFYERSHPSARDAMLVVEVAEASLELDRTVKLPLYASAGIEEVWIVDLEARSVEIYTEPGTEGYQTHGVCGEGETVKSTSCPELALAVHFILGDQT